MIFKDNLFKDKSFLITGASSGMGAHVALTLNELGAKVIAIARSEKKLQEQKNQAKSPENFICISKDLSDFEKLDTWTLELCKEFGGFNGAVFSAGISINTSIRSIDYIQQAKKLFDINYFGNLQVLKGIVDRRARTKEGSSFIWIASTAASVPTKGLCLYSASKAAIIASIKSIALEIAPKFRINSISPALVETPLLKTNNFLQDYKKIADSTYPLGVGKVENITPMACFLLSEDSSWITGQDVMITGGGEYK
ncbi:SDR family NAD(P)-dependent oxidoreductase [Campylobacter jejuni]|uniref:SDR family NAD(P)-dependent oxidoreductase n=2 Tax=Campylobacter jejuni TaxID=197 RepID=UPI00204439D4|nr:SDR family oxidoreductase [Campylobacter jejuni]